VFECSAKSCSKFIYFLKLFRLLQHRWFNSAARQGHIGAKTALVGDADTEALDPTEQAITRSFKLMIGAASPDV
jgi:hypothetical protein